jgi:hypothetical protein
VALLGANLKKCRIVMAITVDLRACGARAESRAARTRLSRRPRALGARHWIITCPFTSFSACKLIWTLQVARIILMESALSFGLGVPPPTPTWVGC